MKNKSHIFREKLAGSFRIRVLFLTFCAMLLAGTVTSLFILFFTMFAVLPALLFNPVALTISIFVSSVIIGTVISAFIAPSMLRPISELTKATDRISKGDFSVRLKVDDDDNSQIGKLMQSFNHMASELESIELFRNDFINDFSHEFKTPIVSIRGFAHRLEAGNLDEAQQQEYINIIIAESERLSTMAENILLLNKLENQQIVSNKTVFDLDEQIRSCILLLQRQWEAKNIDLSVDLDDVDYYFDESMMEHVWINLFNNAIKFTPDGGAISFSMVKANGKVTVKVSDTGIGMPPEVCARIFEKFYQGDKSHSGKGNGIGLNITQRIVALCGGTITAESQPGQGSTFTVTLPDTTDMCKTIPYKTG